MIPVGGITPLSTIDWPERLAAVLFVRGCPWRCPYCHNPEFQQVRGDRYPWEHVRTFLAERRGLLDGVVFSGGEPTLHPGLVDAVREVRSMGFGTALHTGGHGTERLRALLDAGLIDWVGFDVKAPFDDYPLITGRADSGNRARRSLQILVESGVPYELRTTVYTPVLDDDRLAIIAHEVGQRGGGNLVLQRCLHTRSLVPDEQTDLEGTAARLAGLVGPVAVRDAAGAA